MKKIVRYTPHIDHSDFLPHLIEHCVCHPETKELSTIGWEIIHGNSAVEWDVTYFECENFIENATLVEYCQRACITKQKIKYEYDVFKEEFDTKDYKIRVYDKYKQQTNDKKRSSSPYPLTEKKVKSYFNEWYKQGRYCIYDTETWIIIDYNTECNSQISNKGAHNPKSYKQYTILLDGEKNSIVSCKNPTPYDIHLFSFLERFCDAVDLYHKRYTQWSNFRHSTTCINTKDDIYLRLSPHIHTNCTEDFFFSFQQWYCKKLENNGFPLHSIRTLLYRWQKMDNEEIISLISSLKPKQINTMLWWFITIQ